MHQIRENLFLTLSKVNTIEAIINENNESKGGETEYISRRRSNGHTSSKKSIKERNYEKTIISTVNLLSGNGIPDDFTCFCKK
jgi:hypothetical protein